MPLKVNIRHRLLALALMLVLGFSLVIPAYAADAHTYYIQTAIDTSNWIFVGAVVNDKDALFGNYTETERIGSDALKGLLASSSHTMFSGKLDSAPQKGGGGNKNYKVLSFPGFDSSGFLTTPQASNAQMDRAVFIKDSLIYDLNTALKTVYGNKNYQSLDAFRNDVKALLSAAESGGTVNGWTISRATDNGLKDAANELKPDDYIILKKGSDSYTLLTGAKKYLSTMSDSDKPSNAGSDTEYITWGILAYEAFVNSTLEKNAVTVDSVYNSTSQGVLESAITDVMSGLVSGIRSILGLWDLDGLIFNQGVRGGSSYVHGIFPSAWEPFIWTFFLVMEILSIAVIMFAIGKHIMDRASATVNPAVRASAMEQIKDMAVAVIVLTLLPMILIALMRLSANLVDVFASFIGDKSITEEIGHFSTGNSLAAIVVGFANLIINIYFNWYYIVRAITVALLMCLSPLFVTTMCLGQGKKTLAKQWLSELVSNIFIQPIHAFMFAFIVLMPKTGRAIESLVFLYCMIPLTSLLKGMIFPGTGDLAHKISSSASDRANQFAKSAGLAAVGGLKGAIQGGIAAHRENKRQQEENGVDNGIGSGEIRQKNVDTGTGSSNAPSPRERIRQESAAGAGEIDSSIPIRNASATAEHTNPAQGRASLSSILRDTVSNLEEKIKTPEFQENLNQAINDNLQQAREKIAEGKNYVSAALWRGNSPEAQARSASMRMIGAAAMTGAAKGWHGQIFSDPVHNRRFSAAQADLQAAYSDMGGQRQENQQANGQTFEERYTDYMPGNAQNQPLRMDYEELGGTQIGEQTRLNMDDLGQQGISHVRKEPDGSVSYDIDMDRTTPAIRQNLLDTMNDPAIRDMAQQQGYTITPHMKNGMPTGTATVKVADNNLTGQRAPLVDNEEITSGGERQALIPSAARLQDTRQRHEEFAGYQQNLQEYENAQQMYEAGEQQAVLPVIEQETAEKENLDYRANRLLANDQNGRQTMAEIRRNGVHGGYGLRSAAVMGAEIVPQNGGYTANVTAEHMEQSGIQNFQMRDDGKEISYTVSQTTTNSELSAILADRQAAKAADQKEVAAGRQAHFLQDFDQAYAQGTGKGANQVITNFQDNDNGTVTIRSQVVDNSSKTFGTVSPGQNTEFTVTEENISFAPQRIEPQVIHQEIQQPATVGSAAFLHGDKKTQEQIKANAHQEIEKKYAPAKEKAAAAYRNVNPQPQPPVPTERIRQAEAEHNRAARQQRRGQPRGIPTEFPVPSVNTETTMEIHQQTI